MKQYVRFTLALTYLHPPHFVLGKQARKSYREYKEA
jgi:hypothetical protein